MSIFGALATCASLSVIIFGLTSQVILNWKRKSTKGLSPMVIITAMISYLCWAAYGWTKPDPFLQIAQTPGALICIIILWQIFYYGKNKKNS